MTYLWIVRRKIVSLVVSLACMLFGLFAGRSLTWTGALLCVGALLAAVGLGVGLGCLRRKPRRKPLHQAVLKVAYVDDNGDLQWRNADEASVDAAGHNGQTPVGAGDLGDSR